MKSGERERDAKRAPSDGQTQTHRVTGRTANE